MDNGIEWEMRVSDEGRTIYALRTPLFSFPVGGVTDFWPSRPRYRIHVVVPPTTEWADDLDEAKGRLISLFCTFLLNRSE